MYDQNKSFKKDKKIKEKLLQHIHEKIDYSREMEETEIRKLIGESLTEYGHQDYLSLKEKEKLGKELFYAIRNWTFYRRFLRMKKSRRL